MDGRTKVWTPGAVYCHETSAYCYGCDNAKYFGYQPCMMPEAVVQLLTREGPPKRQSLKRG